MHGCTAAQGGGLFATGVPLVAVFDSTFDGNVAALEAGTAEYGVGGAMLVLFNGTDAVHVSGVALTRNEALRGGGMALGEGPAGLLAPPEVQRIVGVIPKLPDFPLASADVVNAVSRSARRLLADVGPDEGTGGVLLQHIRCEPFDPRHGGSGFDSAGASGLCAYIHARSGSRVSLASWDVSVDDATHPYLGVMTVFGEPGAGGTVDVRDSVLRCRADHPVCSTMLSVLHASSVVVSNVSIVGVPGTDGASLLGPPVDTPGYVPSVLLYQVPQGHVDRVVCDSLAG